MRERLIEDLLGSELHATLLRFLAAADEGLDESFLTPDERSAIAEMEVAGAVRRHGGRIRLEPSARQALARAGPDPPRDRPSVPSPRHLDFIQELTRVMTRSRNVADLMRSSFATLASEIPFDLAAAVILEQNIDVYLSRREGIEEPVSDRFGVEIRRVMQKVLDVSFGETDLLIRENHADFPPRPDGEVPYAHSDCTVLRQDSRNAGVLAVFSREPFPPGTQRLLELLSAQISIILGAIRTTERIQNLADTDELTGIWNKRWLRRQLPSEIERSRIYNIPLSLAMFDIDDFKKINDTHGHVIGDVLLSELCGTVRETLRPPDTLARFGGDEFAVVLPHSDLYGARAVADRILQRARALRILAADGVSEVRCTVSVGIATYVPPSMSSAELIQRADERLYESKRLGKNRASW
ncbi:MAG TPA: diguanylate cyclase [Thermoanaerobaculia bacterium]